MVGISLTVVTLTVMCMFAYSFKRLRLGACSLMVVRLTVRCLFAYGYMLAYGFIDYSVLLGHRTEKYRALAPPLYITGAH